MLIAARRLAEERVRHEPRQTVFAARIGISAARQSLLERGDRELRGDYLARIAAEGLDVSYILTGHRSGGEALTKEEGAIVHHARHLGGADRQALIRLAAAASGKPLPEESIDTAPSEEALTLMFQAMLSQLVPPIDDFDAARTLARRLPAALAQTRGRDLAQVPAESPAADMPPPPPAKRRPARSPTPRT